MIQIHSGDSLCTNAIAGQSSQVSNTWNETYIFKLFLIDKKKISVIPNTVETKLENEKNLIW